MNRLTQEQINRINENLNPIELLQRHGYTPKRTGNDRYACQALHRGDSNTSMSVTYKNGIWLWHDFTGTNVKAKNSGGNTFQLLMEFNDTIKEAVKEYEEITGDILEPPEQDPGLSEEVKRKLYFLEKNIPEWNNQLINPTTQEAKEALDILLKRGYTKEYIKEKQIGFNPYTYTGTLGSIIFPLKDTDNKIKSYIYKAIYKPDYNGHIIKYGFDNKENPKFSAKGYWEKLLYNLDTTPGASHVYIVEGICDSDMILIDAKENHISSIALAGNSSFTKEKWTTSVIPNIKRKKVTLIFDNDATAINKFYPKAINNLLSNGIYDFNVEIVPRNNEVNSKELKEIYKDHFNLDLNTEFKDINDYYINYKTLSGLHRTSVNGIYYLALHYKNNNQLDKFEEILKKISRHLSRVKLIQILEKLQEDEIFSEDIIQEYKRIIKKPPTDNDVSEYIRSKHELRYNKKIGFLEFNKVWKKKEEAFIYKFIDEALGKNFRKGSRYQGLIKILQSDTFSEDIIFNKKELMIFQNGTLDLKTGDFKEYIFASKDNMTNISGYNYNKNAKCDNWIKFLNDVCEAKEDPEDTKKKIQLLQEFAGYILFSDCRLEKALILYGSGSNGKSVFMKILKEVFKDHVSGDDNTAVSEVDISNLNRSFYTIKLKDSLLNISSEAKDSLFGSEEKLKQVISGETIEDSYKNQDRISFTPRSKFIISANNDIQPKDLSHGLDRRLLFISFNNRYVDEVTKDNHRKKDINLVDKLKKELSGIFNWCYEGYQRLKKNKEFTLPKDHLALLEVYRDNINSVRQFIKDDSFGIIFNNSYIAKEGHAKIGSRDTYRYYVGYCTRVNAHPLGERRFKKEFENILEELGFLVEYRRSNKGYAYKLIPGKDINLEWLKEVSDCKEKSPLQSLKDTVDLPSQYDIEEPEPEPPINY